MKIKKVSSDENSGFEIQETGTTRTLKVLKINPKQFKIAMGKKIIILTEEELLKLAETMNDLVVRNSRPKP